MSYQLGRGVIGRPNQISTGTGAGRVRDSVGDSGRITSLWSDRVVSLQK
jgi:hypothetical protein